MLPSWANKTTSVKVPPMSTPTLISLPPTAIRTRPPTAGSVAYGSLQWPRKILLSRHGDGSGEMAEAEIERYNQLATLTTRVARAAAELEAVRGQAGLLPPPQAGELAELTDRLQALHVLLANEVERAWNAAEADARRSRRAEMLGRVHDAVSAETTLPES